MRSSSLIETVNSALRPLLATSRGQQRQETLALFADVHNHRRFVRGQRDGGGKGVVSQVTRLCLTTVIDFGLVLKLARKTCVRAGIINLRFHDLRHTFATRLAAVGVDAFAIVRLLGHATVTMTARYVNSTSEYLQTAIGKLESNLSQNCPKPEEQGKLRKRK